MPVPWPVVHTDDWLVAGLESQGQHPHDWLKHPSQERTWLLRPARPERDRSLSEDLAEKLRSEFARPVAVPAAPVELAIRAGVRGALVEDVRLPDWELQPMQALLPEVVPDFDPREPEQRGHNVAAVRGALERFGAPPGSDLPPGLRAFDAFAGYLVLDALIAHGDRYDRNGAVLVPPPGVPDTEPLCASFDHARQLGVHVERGGARRAPAHGEVSKWAAWPGDPLRASLRHPGTEMGARGDRRGRFPREVSPLRSAHSPRHRAVGGHCTNPIRGSVK